MANHLVQFQPQNLLGAPLSDVKQEVSFDDGQSFRPLQGKELSDGFATEEGRKFVARISRAHYWTVTQPLIVKPDPGSHPFLDFAGAREFGSEALSSVAVNAGLDHNFAHFYSSWVTLFRDGAPGRAAHNNTPVPAFSHTLLAFDGADVLSGSGTGYGRFAAHVQPGAVPFGSGAGRLVFAQTFDDSVPQLAAVFAPDGLDFTQPVPVHVFFLPSTGGKTAPYPFSDDGANSFNAVFHNYLVGGGKRLLNQHAASRVRALFVLPLPPPSGYYSGVQDARRLRQYCLELVYYTQRTLGSQRFPTPALGRCALSGFSEGGKPLHEVVRSSAGAFPELAEVYGFDIVAPSGTTQDTGSYMRLLGDLEGWARSDPSRRVRLYTQSPAFNACAPNSIKPAPVRRAGGAEEARAPNSTFFFAPIAFWDAVRTEQEGTSPNPQLDYGDRGFRGVHQLMPSVFLHHALVNSGFAKG